MIKGAIFDLDGTLVDSMGLWHEVDRIFLNECGVAIPPDLPEILRKMTIDECVAYFSGALGVKKSKAEILARIDELMRELYLTQTPLKPFAREFLDGFQRAGIKMCIATANDFDLSRAALAHHGILGHFAFIVTCSQLSCSKTESVIFERCARELGFPPNEILVFEDSLHCAEAAKSAGFRVVGVFDAFSAQDETKMRALCDHYIKSFESGFVL